MTNQKRETAGNSAIRLLSETDLLAVAGGVTAGPDGRGCTEPTLPGKVNLPTIGTTIPTIKEQ